MSGTEADEIRLSSRGEWRPDHGIETRLDLGQSDQGWHYRVLVARPGWENDPEWSKALPKEDAARRAGEAQQDRAHGIERRERAPTTPRGFHAEKLQQAAARRETARSSGGRPFQRAAEIAMARATISEARSMRQEMQRWRPRLAEPSRSHSR